MSSDFNYNFGFVVKEIFELGHAIKSRCFDTQKKFVVWRLSDSKYCFAFVVDKLSWLRHTISTSTYGHSCSKKLNTRQSKIYENLPRVFQHFELSSPSAQAFCSYLSYFAAAIWKSIATFTPTFQQIEMEFWWKNGRKFWMPGMKLLSCPCVTQSLYNLFNTPNPWEKGPQATTNVRKRG